MRTATDALWSIDEDEDRLRASDRFSRYGAYLDARLPELIDLEVHTAEDWAAWCWQVATPPVMSPGYVAWTGPVESTSCWRSCTDGRLVAAVVVRVPSAGLAARLPRPWQGWTPDGAGALVEPRAACTALARVTLEGPLDGEWPLDPEGLFDRVDRRGLGMAAKAAVTRIVYALDRRFAPAVEALRA